MSSDLIQHAVVTVAAIGAGSVIVRRLAAFVWPKQGAPTCGNCSSGQQRSSKRAPARAIETTVLQIQRRRS